MYLQCGWGFLADVRTFDRRYVYSVVRGRTGGLEANTITTHTRTRYKYDKYLQSCTSTYEHNAYMLQIDIYGILHNNNPHCLRVPLGGNCIRCPHGQATRTCNDAEVNHD